MKLTPLSPRVVAIPTEPCFKVVELVAIEDGGFSCVTYRGRVQHYGNWHSLADLIEWLETHHGKYDVGELHPINESCGQPSATETVVTPGPQDAPLPSAVVRAVIRDSAVAAGRAMQSQLLGNAAPQGDLAFTTPQPAPEGGVGAGPIIETLRGTADAPTRFRLALSAIHYRLQQERPTVDELVDVIDAALSESEGR